MWNYFDKLPDREWRKSRQNVTGFEILNERGDFNTKVLQILAIDEIERNAFRRENQYVIDLLNSKFPVKGSEN